jgi:nicotinamide-nucleotide amidase
VTACIIAVGSELLTPFRVDTNSLAITQRLNEIGFDVRLKAVVGDDVAELAKMLSEALGTVQLIVTTGGLGPTDDDITRDALARVLGVPLDFDEAIADGIRERFAQRGLAMPEINRRQAMVPRGAIALDNRKGSAPGLWIERGPTKILVLPGPPREMTPMLEEVIRERLTPQTAGAGLFRRVVRITGRTESDVDSRVQPVYSRWRDRPVPIATTILAVSGQIELHLTASAAGRAAADVALEEALGELKGVLGPLIYSVDGRPLEAVVGDLLRGAGWTISVAESCTGGLLMSRLTDIPGSSDYADRGIVCYSNRSKVELLGIPEALIEQHGAVSEPVARAMAEGVRAVARSDVGIGITGIAGPGGGTPDKPVGTVAIAVAAGEAVRVRMFNFFGGREMVKFQSTQAALNMLRLMMTRTEELRN